MIKLKTWVSKVLLVFCILLAVSFSAYAVNSQWTAPQDSRSEVATKPELARTILSDSGIAQRYDLYLGNSTDIMVSWNSPKFRTWLHQVFVQSAGWTSVEAQYVKRLETDFSEGELQELSTLVKKSVMQKLLQAETQSYANSAEIRRKLFQTLWEDYQSGKINPPSEVLK